MKAIQDVWLIGHEFLHETYHSYSTLRQQAEADNRECPYLLDYYNISCHTMGELNGIRSASARIHNCLVSKLNGCKTFPQFIIIVPDNDIIKSSSVDFFDYGAQTVSETILSWLIHNNEKIIAAQKEKMRKLKKGSVLAGEPKIMSR